MYNIPGIFAQYFDHVPTLLSTKGKLGYALVQVGVVKELHRITKELFDEDTGLVVILLCSAPMSLFHIA